MVDVDDRGLVGEEEGGKDFWYLDWKYNVFLCVLNYL